jgi:hypothetical protein
LGARKDDERLFREPLIEAAKGGIGGGGARLTSMGREVLTLYRKMEGYAATSVMSDMEKLRALMIGDSPRRSGINTPPTDAAIEQSGFPAGQDLVARIDRLATRSGGYRRAGPFLTPDCHRALQNEPRSPSSHPKAAAQSDELGGL